MLTNAVPGRKATVACVAVSMSSILALGESTSHIFGPSRRLVATPCQSPPSARARGAGAFGGVVGRRARSSWTSAGIPPIPAILRHSSGIRPPRRSPSPPPIHTMLFMLSGGQRGVAIDADDRGTICLSGLRTARPNSLVPSPRPPDVPSTILCVAHGDMDAAVGLANTRRRRTPTTAKLRCDLSLSLTHAVRTPPSPPQPSRRTATACSSP